MLVGRTPWSAADAPVGLVGETRNRSFERRAGPGGPARTWGSAPPLVAALTVVCTTVVSALDFPFIITKFHFNSCVKWPTGEVTFRTGTSPTCQHLMSLNRIHTHLGRFLAVWITVAGLLAAEHHGTVKFGGLPVPGASVTAIKGDKKLLTTTDENGRYSFADLAGGAWTVEVEMLGFAKLSNEIGDQRLRGPRPAGECRTPHTGRTRAERRQRPALAGGGQRLPAGGRELL